LGSDGFLKNGIRKTTYKNKSAAAGGAKDEQD
jgi:hypothetical protein